MGLWFFFFFFFFNDTATTEIYTLSLHDALPIWASGPTRRYRGPRGVMTRRSPRSEEHTSELQSLAYLVCRLLLEKKNQNQHVPRVVDDKRLRRNRKQHRAAV